MVQRNLKHKSIDSQPVCYSWIGYLRLMVRRNRFYNLLAGIIDITSFAHIDAISALRGESKITRPALASFEAPQYH